MPELSRTATIKLMLTTILGKDSETMPFEVRESGKQLFISSTSKELHKALQTILLSSQKIRGNLIHTIKELRPKTSNVLAITTQSYTDGLSDQKIKSLLQLQADGLFKAIFSQHFLEEIEESSFFTPSITPITRGKTTIKTEALDLDGIYKKSICVSSDKKQAISIHLKKALVSDKLIMELFKTTGFLAIKKALLTESPIENGYTVKKNERDPLDEVVKLYLPFNSQEELDDSKIIERSGIFEARLSFTFDYGHLLRLCAAPEISIRQCTEEHYELIVDTNHLLTYLSAVFAEGFFICEHEGLRPLFFGPSNLVPESKTGVLILDVSGSMGSVTQEYKKQVSTFCEAYFQHMIPGDNLKIVFFNTQITASHLFHFHNEAQRTTYLSEVAAFINQKLSCDGCTAIYDTLHSQLEDSTLLRNKNVHFIVFTDGENNSGTKDALAVAASLEQLKQKTSFPQIFTLGLGDHYQESFFKELAMKSGAEHTHLKTIADFQKIHTYLNKMAVMKAMYVFIQDQIETVMIVPAGEVRLAPFNVNVNSPFQVSGQTFQVKTQIDSLQIDEEKAREALADKSQTIYQEVSFLLEEVKEREEIMHYADLSLQENVRLCGIVKDKVPPAPSQTDRFFNSPPLQKSQAEPEQYLDELLTTSKTFP